MKRLDGAPPPAECASEFCHQDDPPAPRRWWRWITPYAAAAVFVLVCAAVAIAACMPSKPAPKPSKVTARFLV